MERPWSSGAPWISPSSHPSPQTFTSRSGANEPQPPPAHSASCHAGFGRDETLNNRDFMHRRLCQTSCHSSHQVESGDWPVPWKLCTMSSICVLFSMLALMLRAPQTPCIKSPFLPRAAPFSVRRAVCFQPEGHGSCDVYRTVSCFLSHFLPQN